MRFYRNFSIRAKIVSTVLLIVALELMLAAGCLFFLNSVNDNLSEIVHSDVEKLNLAGRIKNGLLEVHLSQKNTLMSTSQKLLDQEITRKHLYIEDVRAALADIDRFIAPRERAALTEMQVLLNDFLRIDNQIENFVLEWLKSDMALTYIRTSATALSTGRGRTAYNAVAGLVDGVVKGVDASIAENRRRSTDHYKSALLMMLGICAASIFGGLIVGFSSARTISGNLVKLVAVTDAVARGSLDTHFVVHSGDETGRLATSIRQMQTALRQAATESTDRDFVKTGVTQINDAMRGQVYITDLCTAVINETASYLEARVGGIFLMNDRGPEPMLEFSGGYAYGNSGKCPLRFRVGEGLVGQAALNKAPISVHDLPADYIKVCSALGYGCPSCIIIAPLIFEDHVNGVVELAFFRPPSPVQLEYLKHVLPAIAVSIETVRGREHLTHALAKEQILTEELQRQQDELKSVNAELEEQTQRLTNSEEKLRRQQEYLETINTELEEKNNYLENNKAVIERSNRELQQTRLNIEEKVEQLALAGRYKSEFLANMSHELRTPLNSILLLAGMLAENKEGNLTEKQARSAAVIHSSGNDLLSLINEILDLARIEAGKMDLRVEAVDLHQLADSITDQFGLLVEKKGLRFDVRISEGCPEKMRIDPKRLGQILRNLISNAIKFTSKGGISMRIGRPGPQDPLPEGMQRETTVLFAVRDTGIGISPDQQQIVFEAFQQLDHGAARRFPGTGLGLSISKELAHLMGGEILLSSGKGLGSTFTVMLPDKIGQFDPNAMTA